MGRALEHHVLEQMRESAAVGRIILRADVIPDLNGHRRRGVVLDRIDLQAVRERAMAILNRRDGDRRGEENRNESVHGRR